MMKKIYLDDIDMKYVNKDLVEVDNNKLEQVKDSNSTEIKKNTVGKELD